MAHIVQKTERGARKFVPISVEEAEKLVEKGEARRLAKAQFYQYVSSLPPKQAALLAKKREEPEAVKTYETREMKAEQPVRRPRRRGRVSADTTD